MRTWKPWKGRKGHTFEDWPIRVLTQAGAMWRSLKRHERSDPFNDEQVTIVDLPPIKRPRASRFGTTRRERMEWAVRFLASGRWTLRVGDYAYDVGFNNVDMVVRVAARALADVYDVALYMGAVDTTSATFDWRMNEMTPEDFYAA